MVKSYYVKQKKQSECVVPGSERCAVKTKNGQTMMKCKCAECGITETRFVKGKLNSPSEKAGTGIGSTLLTTALDLGMHAAPIIAKKAVEAGRYYASKAMRDPKLQKKLWIME